MSLSFVNVATQNQTSGSVTTITCNVPTSTVDGDMMLLSVCHSVNRTISSGLSAWSLVREQAGTDGIHIYKRTASSEPASYTVTFSAGTQSSIGIISWHSTTAAAIVVDTDSTPQSNITSTNIDWPSVNTTRANSIVHFFGVCDFGSGNVAPDAACDERWDVAGTGHHNYLMTDAVAGTGATGTRTATIGTGSASRTITVAIAEDAVSVALVVADMTVGITMDALILGVSLIVADMNVAIAVDALTLTYHPAMAAKRRGMYRGEFKRMQ
jgi:hypothetical protein